MQTIQLVALTAIWFFMGTQSYIYWVNKYNRIHYKKWRKTQIDLTMMDDQSKYFYLRELISDLLNNDLDQDLLNYAQQAIEDLDKLAKTQEN